MEIILRESERLNALVTDFLLFAQPPKSNKAPWDIRPLLEETLDLFRHSPEYREEIQIHRSLASKEVRVHVDPDQIKQVFWNLLLNAAQAMGGEGDLRVTVEPGKDGTLGDSSPSWIRIAFSDSGKGIPPEEREKIFEPFYTTRDQGSGLGLAIVHKIVENHAGMIKVESELGKGSTFTLFLPAQIEEIRE